MGKKIKVALVQQSYVFDELHKIIESSLDSKGFDLKSSTCAGANKVNLAKFIESNFLHSSDSSSGVALESWQFDLSQKMLEKSADYVREAAKNANLVVLQELHATQYFCQSEESKYFEFASDFKGHIEFFSRLARECGVVLVTSLFEGRAAGIYHNTAIVFESDGSVAGMYRKMHIPDDPQFYEKFYFTQGDLGFEPIETSLGRLGVLICWDQWYPEAARLMAMAGADMLIFPTAIGWFDCDSTNERERQKEAWITMQRSHAIANGLPVIAVNRIGFEPLLDSKNLALWFMEFANLDSIEWRVKQGIKGINFFGGSFACGAQGEILTYSDSNKDEILYTGINFDRTKEVRDIWPFFRDRRIESYGDLVKRYRI